MTAGRYKRRKTSSGGGGPRSGVSEKLISPSRPSADEALLAVPPAPPGVDLYAQARKALTERCPFDGDESALRVGTLPSVLAASLQRQSDGRRKHRKVQDDAARPVRPPALFSLWEKTEEYFRPVTLDDIDLLVRKLPPDSCFYLPGSESLLEEVKKDEAVPRENPPGEMDVSPSSAVVIKETENVEMEAASATETDRDVTCSTTALPVEKPELNDKKSLNWILGCKQRFLLTSERPSKKRKHLGGDAGLEQLLLLPYIEKGAERWSPRCDFCCSREGDEKSNRLLFCDSCKVSVHQKCYGVMEVPVGAWLCSWCNQRRNSERNGDDKDSSLRPCLLCPKAGGALKPFAGNLECSAETKFVHLFCSLWTPEVYVEDVGVMEPIMNVGVLETRRRLVCNLCKVKHGVCVRCSHGTCRTSLHPVCARAAKHQMEIWGKIGHDNVELRAFCLKHSSVQKIPSAEHPSRSSDDDFLVGKLYPATAPIKRIPKIRITRKSKNKNLMGDGTAGSVSGEVAKDDANLDHESLVLKIIPECREMADVAVPDNGNVLLNAPDVIKIFRRIIERRRINIGDVALELGVSSASLESAMTGEGTLFPSELRLKVIQWIKNLVHVQPSTRHSKSRNGSTISSGGLIARDAGPNASCLQDTLPAVIDPLVVQCQPPCRIKNNRHNSGDDNVFSSTEEVFQPDCNREFVLDVDGLQSDLRKDIVKDTSDFVFVSRSHIEDFRPEEHKVSEFPETIFANTTFFPDSNASGELLHKGKDAVLVPDNSEASDLKEVSDCSNLVVENAQTFEDDITELRSDSLLHTDGHACEAEIPNIKDVESCSRSDIHPFILKKLNELQNQWHLLHNPRNIKADYNGYGNSRIDTQPTTWIVKSHMSSIVDQISKAKSVEILDLSPADELEGELLYLQNWLLNRTISMKHSCEEVIFRMIQHLPQELDAFRKKRWDMVHINQYINEVKEAKKRGRKDRKHKEVQAMLVAATAAATASRNSLPRKDSNNTISSSHQQNPLKISSASGRTAGHSLPATRLKETLSRSSIAKVSSDKHSGNFKLPDFAKENTLFCDICWRSETIVNRIFVCSSCKVAVHLNCYRRLKDHPNGPWSCELCEDTSLPCPSPRIQQFDSSEKSCSRVQCSLCGGGTGAFRKSIGGEWVHAFCAEWVLESTYKRGQQNLVEGMDAISKEKDLNTCCICHYRLGLCLKCSYGHCQTTFHPTCARRAEFFMNLKAIGGRFQHKAYCEKHSVDQREKVDSQHGAEELKSVKQVRVELEKVRLLCERIIKREKIKRDLVVCSHGILASRRDCVAFSALFYGSFTCGISSESATTTIDNPSYSGIIQRSDDITVDSTISGRHSGRIPLDVDRKTDDSSTSQLSIKRNITDRMKFSGKQLPQRPTTASWNSADGEKNSKARKGIRNLERL